MKQDYTAAELKAEIGALENVFDSVQLIDPETMQFLDPETLQAAEPCRILPPLNDDGRGWQPMREGESVALACCQAICVDGRHCMLVVKYELPQTLPENSRDANAFMRILTQYSEELRHDYVTGAYNQRYLQEEYIPALADRLACGAHVALALARVNEYGHICANCGSDAADRCLNTAAGILQIAVGLDNEKGILARLEDGVFLVTAIDATPAQLEKTLNEAIDSSRKDYNISLSRRGEFTISVSAADWAETGNWDLLVALAERRLSGNA